MAGAMKLKTTQRILKFAKEYSPGQTESLAIKNSVNKSAEMADLLEHAATLLGIHGDHPLMKPWFERFEAFQNQE